ncbi:MAG TPA: Wzz/FepE/Etk N-terminal domain-containing protein [candidate division Zixibacteria bacterium]
MKEEEKINIFNYLLVLTKYRKFILLNVVAVCLVVAIVSLFLPSWYAAELTILPPERESLSLGSSLLSSLSGGGMGGGFALPLMATPSDVIASILQSRAVIEPVINQESLIKVYKANSMEEALKEFSSHMKVKVGSEGIISLGFEDKDRNRAARMANSLALELDRVNQRTNISKAKNARIFIEERLAQTQKDLAQAEDSLTKFKQENSAISLDDQMKAAINAAAELKAELTKAEIDLNVSSKSLDSSHPEIRRLKTRIAELRNQLATWEFGKGGKQKEGEEKGLLEVPFSEVPSLGLELARLVREVKIQESVFGILTEQYEQYKIQETRDTPTIQVLDKAVPPQKKSRPRRVFLVGIAGLVSLFSGIFLVFFLEYFEKTRYKNPEDFKKIDLIFNTLQSDFANLKYVFRKRGLGKKEPPAEEK